jgi:hypothetical protein
VTRCLARWIPALSCLPPIPTHPPAPYARGVTEPRRVLIGWDYGASGIWWVLTKEEKEAPAPGGVLDRHRTAATERTSQGLE